MKKYIFTIIFLMISFVNIKSNSGFYICLGSFQNKDFFIRYHDHLQNAGLPLIVETVETNSGPFYQMYLSYPFPSRESAKEFIDIIHSRNYPLLNKGMDLWIRTAPFPVTSIDSLRSLEGMDFGDEYIYSKQTATYPYLIISEKNASSREPETGIKLSRFSIVNALPQKSATLPSGTPLVVFFSQKLLISSVESAVSLTSPDGTMIPGIIRVFEYARGKSAIAISTVDINYSNSCILSIKSDLLSSTKEPLHTGFNTQVIFQHQSDFSTPIIIGDGEIKTTLPQSIKGDEIFEQCYSLSNSENLVSQNKAIHDTYSFLQIFSNSCHEISFRSNFLSSEFNEFANYPISDHCYLMINGNNYLKTYQIHSVEVSGTNNIPLRYKTYGNLPDKGDAYAGMTGWSTQVFENKLVKGPVKITLIVTDLGSPDYSSILLINNLSIK